MADLILHQSLDGNKQGWWFNDEFYLPQRMGVTLSHPTMDTTLSHIILTADKSGNPDGIFSVSVYETTTISYIKVPTGIPLVTASMAMSVIAVDPGNDIITFAIPITIPAGQTYAVMFESSYYTAGEWLGLGTKFGAGMISSPFGLAGRYIQHVPGHYPTDWFPNSTAGLLFQLYGTLVVPRDPDRPDADLPSFPPARPDIYTPDDFWIPGDWDGDTYTPPEWAGPTPGRYFATGGGRWGQQLVAVGHGKVYYEELS